MNETARTTPARQTGHPQGGLPRHAALALLTRFNAPLPWLNRPAPDAAWLEHRCHLFETFCLPTVQAQSFQDFRWMVYFDSRTPDAVRARIDSYRRSCRQLEPCFVDELDNAVASQAIRDSCGDDVQFLVTVRLDNDDAVSRQFLSRFAAAVRPHEPERRFINMRRGYTWKEGRVFEQDDPSSPFFAVIEPRRSAVTGLSFDHTKMAEHGDVQQIVDGRHFLQVVHGRNVSNSLRGRPREVSARGLLPQFPSAALDVPPNALRRMWWNGLGAVSQARRTLRRVLSQDIGRLGVTDPSSRESLSGLSRGEHSSPPDREQTET
ncbi:glycosyltransferase [Planctomyces sp. SH-PL14]|uniref:glycosyltransferase n=1 Tax=Planctomyces sp. SH-PL14 TaxID=1632864 RepID=UPI0009461FEE|nr:glycosyltransferase [Planctomyces sp. SH-PL14]